MTLITKNNKNLIKGFSLVELLVAVSIFSIIAVVAMGALYSVQNANTKTQQAQVILDGMNLSMEQMVRDIRYGSIFHCDNVIPTINNISSAPFFNRADCVFPASSGNVLVFKPSNSLISTDRISYYLSNGSIMKLDPKVSSSGVQITSNDVKIKTLNFFVEGTNSSQAVPADYDQPLITIVISGVTIQSKVGVAPVKFSLQTSVSARLLDN